MKALNGVEPVPSQGARAPPVAPAPNPVLVELPNAPPEALEPKPPPVEGVEPKPPAGLLAPKRPPLVLLVVEPNPPPVPDPNPPPVLEPNPPALPVFAVLPKRLPPVLLLLVVPKPPVRFCWPPNREPDWFCVLEPNPEMEEKKMLANWLRKYQMFEIRCPERSQFQLSVTHVSGPNRSSSGRVVEVSSQIVGQCEQLKFVNTARTQIPLNEVDNRAHSRN